MFTSVGHIDLLSAAHGFDSTAMPAGGGGVHDNGGPIAIGIVVLVVIVAVATLIARRRK